MISVTFCFAFSVTCNMETTSCGWNGTCSMRSMFVSFDSIQELEYVLPGRARARARGKRRVRARAGGQRGNHGVKWMAGRRHEVLEGDAGEEPRHLGLDPRQSLQREAPAE